MDSGKKQFAYFPVCQKCKTRMDDRYAVLKPCPHCGGDVKETYGNITGIHRYRFYRIVTTKPHPFFLFRWLGIQWYEYGPWYPYD